LQPFGGAIEGSCCQFTPPLPGNKTEPFEFDCAFRTNLWGVAFYDVADFARENKLFYRYYREAWNVATENGYDNLKNITSFNHTRKPDGWDQECSEAGGVCSNLRWADGSPQGLMDEGINAVRNWYSLAADTVPEVYRQ